MKNIAYPAVLVYLFYLVFKGCLYDLYSLGISTYTVWVFGVIPSVVLVVLSAVDRLRWVQVSLALVALGVTQLYHTALVEKYEIPIELDDVTIKNELGGVPYFMVYRRGGKFLHVRRSAVGAGVIERLRM